ncbi:SulP family inorganic anion transporter [Aidingimonas halophila]|uniref:Sulfate permease, SulP family n=1 Tax=Aidingimonas halophila TaxID=574349 RepID=A0A1H3BDG6_9GAMM|nr:sulfate permease [Aidingimonas halophila]GHC26333.1 sodium-independent anion transporter [Aidingimonas halophila]SDX39993.1 sulfate permease, SulP family [Aidingimonas halophila]
MLKRYLPILQWLPHYNRHAMVDDTLAAFVVTLMVIPQALAYALLAGLPAVVGLYASILPLVVYTLFGTSRTLAIGPMALISLMTAAALSKVAPQGSDAYIEAAITLTLMVGILLTLMGALRLGFFANFLSHPVISGLLSASGVLIAASQLANIAGLPGSGFTLTTQLANIWHHLDQLHPLTLAIGVVSLILLLAIRRSRPLLERIGLSAIWAQFSVKMGPILVVGISTWLCWVCDFAAQGLDVVGDIPSRLPPLGIPSTDGEVWQSLLVPALMISVVGFIESVALAQMLAAKRRESISPNQELIGLGTANIASALSSGMPVIGSLSRTMVNFDAGARTPAAGALAGLGVALVTLFLTPLIKYLPIATLAAIIIASSIPLIDIATIRRTWRYSRSDSSAMGATIVLTLLEGVELGIMAGVTLSIALFLYRTSRPHSALVGRLPGTEHFRNIDRHEVESARHLALLRIDESLYFANARYLEDTVYDLVAKHPDIEHVVLICSAVNLIDASALESLEAINNRLDDSRVTLHLAEVKGPVMDKLKSSDLLDHLTGRVFLSTYDAWRTLH